MNKTVNIRTFPLQNYYVISIFSWQKTCYKTYFYTIYTIHYKSANYMFCGSIFLFRNVSKVTLKNAPKPCFHMTWVRCEVYAPFLISLT